MKFSSRTEKKDIGDSHVVLMFATVTFGLFISKNLVGQNGTTWILLPAVLYILSTFFQRRHAAEEQTEIVPMIGTIKWRCELRPQIIWIPMQPLGEQWKSVIEQGQIELSFENDKFAFHGDDVLRTLPSHEQPGCRSDGTKTLDQSPSVDAVEESGIARRDPFLVAIEQFFELRKRPVRFNGMISIGVVTLLELFSISGREYDVSVKIVLVL